MSRYRKIEVKTWTDEKFRSLSSMPASGQGLWLFLMTGPHTGPIPGLFRAGRAGMAEELEWDMEAFDKAFREVSSQGMAKADFGARLIWLPNAVRYNKPESPNVVRSWRTELELLPECALKIEAIESIRGYLKTLGDAYTKAFSEICPEEIKPSVKPSLNPMPNQEQEQEQEQENTLAQSDGKNHHAEEFEEFWTQYPKRKSKGQAWKAWKKLNRADRESAMSALPYAKRSHDWRKSGGQFIPYPATWLNARGWEDQHDVDLGEGNAGVDAWLGEDSNVIDGECEHEDTRQAALR